MQNSQPGNQDIFKLAWPLALNGMLLQLVLIVDTVLVTPLGEESLAAMGLAASIGNIMMGLLFAFSNGTQLLMAQAHGGKNHQALLMSFKAGLVVNSLIAAGGWLFIFSVSEHLIHRMAQTPLMAALAYDYLSILAWAIMGIAVCQNITAYFNATGNSRIAFYSNLLEVPFNILISVVLIYGWWGFPALGLSGAAIGTVMAVLLRSLFLLFYYYYHAQHQPIKPSHSALSWQALHHHVKHALPIAGNYASMILTQSVCMLLYAQLSLHAFAAFTLILPWIKVMGFLNFSLAQATGILTGQLLGAKVWDRLDQFIGSAWRMAFVSCIIVALLYGMMFPLFDLVYPGLQAETRQTLWQFLPVLLCLPFIKTSNALCGNILRAGGDAVYTFKIHSLTQWFFTVPMTALLVLYWAVPAVWVFALLLWEEVIKAAPLHRRLLSGVWKKAL